MNEWSILPEKAVAARVPANITGVPVHPYSLNETVAFMREIVVTQRRGTFFYVNAHAAVLAARDRFFRDRLWRASLVFCDGKAVQWAGRLLGHDIPERYTPPDWIDQVCRVAAQDGLRVFFLGAEPGVAEAAAERMRARFGQLEIASHHGYFDKTGEASNAVVELINAFRTDILVVGFGMPVQEAWIEDNYSKLTASVILSVGAMFDYLSGNMRRAPRWITDIGLEWAARLIAEPRRLWRRYLIGIPVFLIRVARQRMRLLPDAARHAGQQW